MDGCGYEARPLTLYGVYFRVHHEANEFSKSGLVFPAQLLPRFRRIREQGVHFGRPIIAGIKFHELLPVEIHAVDPSLPGTYCAVIMKTVDERTRAKTSINELLRD